MNLTDKYTTIILHNELTFRFDTRDAGDYAKSISEILEDFKEEVLMDAKFKPSGQLTKLKRLQNETR